MTELLKGRISDTDGLKEVLEIMATFKEVSTAVLDVGSPQMNGRIGVAWGKFITGALITDTGETGKRALRKLLRLKEGKFSFVDLETEPPIVELRQQLGIDLVRTATVVPALEYREAHFLWDMSEDHTADDYAPLPKADNEDDDEESEQETDDEFELEEEISRPSEPDVSHPAPPDESPVLPNFDGPLDDFGASKKQQEKAVAMTGMNDELRVPEADTGAQADAEAPKARQTQNVESGSTPALDAVFGATFSEPPPPPNPSNRWRQRAEKPEEAASAGDVVAEPMKPPEEKPLEQKAPEQPVEQQPKKEKPGKEKTEAPPVAAAKAAQEDDEEEPAPPRDPKPMFMSRFVGAEAAAAKVTAPEPFEALPKGPLLQPNVVAQQGFVGQQYVEPPAGRVRPPDGKGKSISIGIAVFCVVLFVVSCAGTVIFGPHAWEMLADALHM